MNPILLATLRRNWRIAGAVGALLIFTVVHFFFFRPAANHYRKALASAGGLEAIFNPSGNRPTLPPRLFSLITDQSLTPQDAADRGGSGALGVVLLEDLGRMAKRSGLSVEASEPGLVTQQPMSVQIRAHVTLHGSYASIVRLFDELAASGSLMMVDRFRIHPVTDRQDELEVWISRLYLKRMPTNP